MIMVNLTIIYPVKNAKSVLIVIISIKLLLVNHIKELLDMWEYEITNLKTKQTSIIFGYSLSDAFKRNPLLIPSEWECTDQGYID
jgi:hypothetical protein